MKSSVVQLLNEAQQKLSAYAALYNYRLHNLNVKADPEALLSIAVVMGEDELPFEKTARARHGEGRDDQFYIFPIDRKFLFPIVKGLKKTHPEYDLAIRDLYENDDNDPEEREQYIVATMPVVNDDRHDALTQAVGVLSDGCKGVMDATLSLYTGRIVSKLSGAPAEDVDEAKEALQRLFDMADGLCKQYRTDKEQEIEDAYAAWQAAQAEKEAKQQEEEAAHNALAGLQMKMNPDEEDE